MHLTSLSLGNADQGARHVKDVILHSAHANSVTSHSMSRLFSRLQRVITNSGSKKYPLFVFDGIDKRIESDLKSSNLHLGIILAIEAGMTDYLRTYENGRAAKLSKMQISLPLLYYALEQPLLKPLTNWRPRNSGDMIEHLLSVGCDPNEPFSGKDESGEEETPWKWLLTKLCHGEDPYPMETVMTFLDKGADVGTANIILQTQARTKRKIEIQKRKLLQMVQNHESVIASHEGLKTALNSGPMESPFKGPTSTTRKEKSPVT